MNGTDNSEHTQAAPAAIPLLRPAKPPARSREWKDARRARYTRVHVVDQAPDSIVRIGGTEYRVGAAGNLIRVSAKVGRRRRG